MKKTNMLRWVASLLLIATALTSATGCDKFDELVSLLPNPIQDAINDAVDEAVAEKLGETLGETLGDYLDEVEETIPEPEYDYLKGDVWAAIRDWGWMDMDGIDFEDQHKLSQQAIPIEFLMNLGLVLPTERSDTFKMAGELQPSQWYEPFDTRAYVDNNTEENDVYLLVNYESGKVDHNSPNSGVYVANWLLKYTLDDDDYETFLKLDGDFRIKYFVKEMDRQYEPVVIHHSLIRHDLISLGSHASNEHWLHKGFPNVFVANIDYDNYIITYASSKYGDLRYYDLDLRKTDNWEKAITRDGLTEEEREASISVKTKSTPLGECLTDFSVNDWYAVLPADQAKHLLDTTDRVWDLEMISVKNNQRTLNNIK